jgi:hypothetical protein
VGGVRGCPGREAAELSEAEDPGAEGGHPEGAREEARGGQGRRGEEAVEHYESEKQDGTEDRSPQDDGEEATHAREGRAPQEHCQEADDAREGSTTQALDELDQEGEFDQESEETTGRQAHGNQAHAGEKAHGEQTHVREQARDREQAHVREPIGYDEAAHVEEGSCT